MHEPRTRTESHEPQHASRSMPASPYNTHTRTYMLINKMCRACAAHGSLDRALAAQLRTAGVWCNKFPTRALARSLASRSAVEPRSALSAPLHRETGTTTTRANETKRNKSDSGARANETIKAYVSACECECARSSSLPCARAVAAAAANPPRWPHTPLA